MSNLLATDLCGVKMQNPVILASGTCGFGKEMAEHMDLTQLGGIASKGLTLQPQPGNPGCRIYETASGIMNSVGLENPGIQRFVAEDLAFLNSLGIVCIVNVGGHCLDDYIQAITILNHQKLDFIELNISCPNVREGGMNLGLKTEVARPIVRTARQACRHKLIVKLSPNAENLVDLAEMCQKEGADAISLTNTFLAMAVDIHRKKPVFDNLYAGLSGPAIKPIALRMVHQVCHAVSIPVIGIGGITTWQDALEFIMAGAVCVQVGTANFMRPDQSLQIIDGLQKYLQEQNCRNLSEVRGIL